MKLDFKRILSFVLALVMTVGTLTVVNVSSVMAADGDRVFDLGSEAVKAKLKITEGKIQSNGSNNPDYQFDAPINDFTLHAGSGREYKSDAEATDGNGYMYMGGSSDKIRFHASNANATLKIRASTKSNPRKFTITGEDGGTATVVSPEGGIIAKDDNYAIITELTYTLDKVDYYTIQGDSNIRIYDVTINDKAAGDEPAPAITWKVNTDDTLNDKVKLEPLTNSNYAVLRYTGEDNEYSVIPSRRIISTADVSIAEKHLSNEGSTYTLDLTGSNWNYYLTKNINVPVGNIVITGGGHRALHLECVPHKTVYTIKLQNNQAYAMIEEGENGGYTIPTDPAETIPLHNGELVASMVGGQLQKAGEGAADEVTFNIDSESSQINATFTPYAIEKVTDSVTEEFNKYKVSSVVRGERLFGGTVLDPEGKHFFVAAEKDLETDGVYTLTDPVALGTDTDMKAAVLRAPGSKTADGVVDDEQGIGFILANKDSEAADYTYTLKVYCTSVNQDTSISQEKGSETSIAIREIDPATYKAKNDGYTKSDAVPVQDDSVITPTGDPITFSNLQPGKAYAIFNPKGGDDEPQGNIRVYSMELEKVDNSSSSSDDNKWSADNQTGLLGAHLKGQATSQSKDSKYVSAFAKEIFTEADGSKSGAIKDKDYVSIAKDTGYFQPSKAGELYLYAIADNNTKKTIQIKHNDENVISRELEGRTDGTAIQPIIFKVEANEKYTLTGANIQLYYAEIQPEGPAVASITGTVSVEKKYEYVKHTADVYTNVKTGSGDEEEMKYVNNVTFTTPDSDNNGTMTVKGEPTALKVTATKDGKAVSSEDIKVSGSSYTIGGTTGVTEGTYQITATDGTMTKTETVVIGAEPASTTQNIVLSPKYYNVRFITNIKNFKDDGDLFVCDSAGKQLFQLDDITYYNDTEKKEVNTAASTTHTVKMPEGSYKYSYESKSADNAVYRISNTDDNNIPDENAEIKFDIKSNSRQNIYFRPLKEKLGETVESEIKDAQTKVATGAVKNGVYTFDYSELSDTAAQATVKYKATQGEAGDETDTTPENDGIIAYGIKATKNEDTYFGLNIDNGAIVFRLDKPMLAHIKTEQKACILYNLDDAATTSINGIQSIIPTDISYSERTVSLKAGTYALASLTPSGTDKTAAKVTYIEFIGGSPFKVTDDVKDYNGSVTGKMIIGKYDSTNDELAGSTTAESYSKFAIIVAANESDLTVDFIDNIAGASGTYNNEDYNRNVTKSDETGVDTQAYNPDVHKLTLSNGNVVLIDETETIFSKIYDESGAEIKANETDNEMMKYYATVVKGLQSGKYYAVGAAKFEEPGDTNKDTWLIQDEKPVEFTVAG